MVQCSLCLILTDDETNPDTQRCPIPIQEHGSVQDEVRPQSMGSRYKKYTQCN
jgi:hypothetical protein